MPDKTRPAIPMPQCEAHIAKGDWNPLWDQLRELDPEFMEAYLAFRSVPQRNGPLPQKYKELILVAINAATTHLYGPGVRRHMRNAVKAGATREELLEAIQLTTVMGIHSCNLAIPILMEETAGPGAAQPLSATPAQPEVSRMNTAARFRIDTVELGRRTADTSLFLYLTEPGTPLEIAYRVWVLRDGDRTILVDTGPPTQEGHERGLTQVVDVAAALARIGVDAARIDTVLLTHLHWDHAANAEQFPNATFFAQQAELDFFASAVRQHPAFNRFYSVRTDLTAMIGAQRIRPLDGDVAFCPGIRVIRVGGHTPGSQMICVDTEAGLAVITGDAIPLCRNYRDSIPSGIVSDVGEAVAALERVARLAPARIYPGHDTQESFAPLPLSSAPGA